MTPTVARIVAFSRIVPMTFAPAMVGAIGRSQRLTRRRVVGPDNDPAHLLLVAVHLIRFVHKLFADTAQLRQPQLDIVSVAVVVVGLFMNVEVPGPALRVEADAGDIIPISI